MLYSVLKDVMEGILINNFFLFYCSSVYIEHLEWWLFLPLSLRLLKYNFKILFINSHHATEFFVMSLKTKANFVCSWVCTEITTSLHCNCSAKRTIVLFNYWVFLGYNNQFNVVHSLLFSFVSNFFLLHRVRRMEDNFKRIIKSKFHHAWTHDAY